MSLMPLASRLALVVGLAASATAPAAILNWNDPTGGPAWTPANWNPGQMPLPADDLVFNLAATYSVNYNSTVGTSRTHVYNRGNVTVQCSNPHSLTGGATIANWGTDNAIVTHLVGTWTLGSSLRIAVSLNSVGSLTINDSATFIAPGAQVGGGTGTLSVVGGGRAFIDDIIVGSNDGAGTIVVTGIDDSSPIRSTLDASGGGAYLTSPDYAVLQVLSGGLARFGFLTAGLVSNEAGSITVGGVAGGHDATLEVAENLRLGNNGAPPSNSTSGGAGSLTVNAGGFVTVGETLFAAGDPDGGTATVQLNEDGRIEATSAIFGTASTFQHTGGMLLVDGGPLDLPGTNWTINSTTGTPLIELRNGSTVTLAAPNIFAKALTIGSSGSGTIITRHPSTQVIVTSGPTVMGDLADGYGQMVIDSGSRFTYPYDTTLTIGRAGGGWLTVSGAATVVGGTASVGSLNGGSGIVSLFGIDTDWRVNGSLYIGGSSSGPGGTGTVNVNSNATLTVLGTEMIVHQTGQLTVNNGTIDSDAEVSMRGGATMTGGTINAPMFDLDGGDMTAGGGLINADCRINFAASDLTLTDDMTIGRVGAGRAIVNSGTLAVGDHALTLRGTMSSFVNSAAIGNNGSITSPEGLIVSHLFTLSGGGAVYADVTNHGSILAGGSDLDFYGVLTGVGDGISGVGASGIRFLGSSGGFVGSGLIDCRVWAAGGAGITATGNLTMGDAADANGVRISYTMAVGQHIVTLRDSNGPGVVSGTIDMRGGRVVSATPISGLSSYFLGNGIIFAPSLSLLQCVVAPGTEGSDETGTMILNGDLTINNGATSALDMEIAGSAADERDSLVVTGQANLYGILKARFIEGFQPVGGEEFVLLNANPVLGEFSTLDIPANTYVHYTATTVTLGVYCPADIDDGTFTGTRDGGVTIDDLLYYLFIFDLGLLAADVDDGSFTGTLDGGVTIDDLLYYLFRFDAGC